MSSKIKRFRSWLNIGRHEEPRPIFYEIFHESRNAPVNGTTLNVVRLKLYEADLKFSKENIITFLDNGVISRSTRRYGNKGHKELCEWLGVNPDLYWRTLDPRWNYDPWTGSRLSKNNGA